jgi:hypothetical protein
MSKCSKPRSETQELKHITILDGTSNWYTVFCDDIQIMRTTLIELKAPNFEEELEEKLQSIISESSSVQTELKSASKDTRKKKVKGSEEEEPQSKIEILQDKANEICLKSLRRKWNSNCHKAIKIFFSKLSRSVQTMLQAIDAQVDIWRRQSGGIVISKLINGIYSNETKRCLKSPLKLKWAEYSCTKKSGTISSWLNLTIINTGLK